MHGRAVVALHTRILPVTPFAQNCSLWWCDETGDVAIIDPGGDIEKIETALRKTNGELKQILVTHGHIDHAGAVAELAARHGVPIVGPHPADAFWIDMLPSQGQMFGLQAARTFTPTRWLADGDTVQVGHETLEVLHTPGHTPGHVVFFHRPSNTAAVGDVLFAGSIGRTDFPQGDHAALLASIHDKLWPLGNNVRFIPGHGPDSTFGQERTSNPFVADHVLAR